MHTSGNPFICRVCGKPFSRSNDLTRHHLTHNEERVYKCDVCAKVFNQKVHLITHRKIHGGVTLKSETLTKTLSDEFHEAPTDENPSEDSFDDPVDLFSQESTSSLSGEDKKPFHCDICVKSVSSSEELTKHRLSHSNVKPFKCEVCGKTFREKGNLKCHIRIHTGEKPFVCVVCGKAFNQSSVLKRHRLMHTNDKPFKCKQWDCDRAFMSKRSLIIHQKVHNG